MQRAPTSTGTHHLVNTRRLACPNEAVSVVTSVSEHARAHGLNPRNIHTGAPTRYYRGIIQTYLYPSPMTADMTCDRLRYRLHDMLRFLAPSFTLPSQFSANPSERPLHTLVFLLALPPSRRWKICNRTTTYNSLAFMYSSQ